MWRPVEGYVRICKVCGEVLCAFVYVYVIYPSDFIAWIPYTASNKETVE